MARPLTEPERLASPAEISAALDRLAADISTDHPDGVTLVGVLKAAVLFQADLARRLTVPTRLELLAVAPYDGATGRTRVVKDLDAPVTGEPTLLVTGIVDTGLTADFLRRHLEALEPASLRTCSLIDKHARRIVPVDLAYRAFDISDGFVLGYGLDFAGRYRNLDGLWLGDGAALAADPECYVASLYRRPAA